MVLELSILSILRYINSICPTSFFLPPSLAAYNISEFFAIIIRWNNEVSAVFRLNMIQFEDIQFLYRNHTLLFSYVSRQIESVLDRKKLFFRLSNVWVIDYIYWVPVHSRLVPRTGEADHVCKKHPRCNSPAHNPKVALRRVNLEYEDCWSSNVAW